MKLFGIVIFFPVFLFAIIRPVYAESSYVLPYPSKMPGNFSYKAHQIYESISKYWYFGNFGQFDHNLKMSDKYLVEAKTLFEYRQYLLGYQALKKADIYFVKIYPNLVNAEKNHKNISQKREIYIQAAQKHIETLGKMMTFVPDVFDWQPEKVASTKLNIKDAIETSIKIRSGNL